ncbi:hypothetical protein DPV78_001631 [Talaromyces pinophilus]|nr:hypothetical protein DPV78_001631 [Talaromyces pinophilus]
MHMPEYPYKERLLKPIERDYAVWRLEMEACAGEANDLRSPSGRDQDGWHSLIPRIWVDGSWVSEQTRNLPIWQRN